MTLTLQRKLFVFCINIHLSRIGRHFEFGGHFGAYINYYKSETFLMGTKTFVDNFIGSLQEIVLCRSFNRFFFNYFAAILELAAIATFKRKIRDENIRGITEYI